MESKNKKEFIEGLEESVRRREMTIGVLRSIIEDTGDNYQSWVDVYQRMGVKPEMLIASFAGTSTVTLHLLKGATYKSVSAAIIREGYEIELDPKFAGRNYPELDNIRPNKRIPISNGPYSVIVNLDEPLKHEKYNMLETHITTGLEWLIYELLCICQKIQPPTMGKKILCSTSVYKNWLVSITHSQYAKRIIIGLESKEAEQLHVFPRHVIHTVFHNPKK